MSCAPRVLILAALLPNVPIAAADECAERGKAVYAKCSVCHPIDAGAGHAAAPNLHGIVDMPVGKQEGWKYSRALRKSEDSWTKENLLAFLESPMTAYPGTSMAFAGLKKAGDRKDIYCYLAAQAGENREEIEK
jgi:cytochrome c